MGIYGTGKVFGICIRVRDPSDSEAEPVTLFEKKSEEEFTAEEKKEAWLFYENLSNKENISFRIDTECYTTLEGVESVRMWAPISLDSFINMVSV